MACILRISPAAPWLPILLIHIVSQVKTIQNQSYNLMNLPILHFFFIFENTLHATHFLKLFDKMRHTFWSCLIRYVNMKWIRWVLLKIQRGHHSVHRWTDRQGETNIPPSSRDYDYYINTSNGSWCQGIKGKCPAQFMSHCCGILFVEYVFESHYLPHHYGQISPYCAILGPHTLIMKYA